MLQLSVTTERHGRPGRPGSAPARRETTAPVWPCFICGQAPRPWSARIVFRKTKNAFCVQDAPAVGTHAASRDGLMPVVNSPRMGVCGYMGET